MIASSEVASASTWPKSNSRTSAGTKMKPAADAEQAAQSARQQTDHDRGDDLEHQTSSQTPITVSRPANA